MEGNFVTRFPEWNNEGSQIPDQKKDEGWLPDEKPAPGYFNRLFYDINNSLKELDAIVFEKENISVKDFGAKGDGETDDTQAIQNAVNETDVIYFPPNNEFLISSAILIPSNTTLLLNNCTIRLADDSNDNIFRNQGATEGLTEYEKDINIFGIGKVILDGNEAGQEDPRETDWRHIGVLLRNVDGFRTENLTVKNTAFWGMSYEDCKNGKIKDIHFDQDGLRPNQDGIDLRIGCKNITIENITGQTEDDTIALTALQPEDGTDGYEYPEEGASQINNTTLGTRHIENIIIRNVKTKVIGGHNVVRLLCSDGNRITGINVQNVEDITFPDDIIDSNEQIRSVISLNWGEYGETPPSPGDLLDIYFDNIQGLAKSIIKCGNPFEKATFNNIKTMQTGAFSEIENVQPQKMFDFSIADTADIGAFDNITINNAVMQSSFTGDWVNTGSFIYINNNIDIKHIVINNPKIILCTHIIEAEDYAILEDFYFLNPMITNIGLEPFSISNVSLRGLNLILNLGEINLINSSKTYSINFGFKLMGSCPPVTSDDEIPEPIVGSTVIFKPGVNDFTDATYAMGDGTEWQAIVTLPNYS